MFTSLAVATLIFTAPPATPSLTDSHAALVRAIRTAKPAHLGLAPFVRFAAREREAPRPAVMAALVSLSNDAKLHSDVRHEASRLHAWLLGTPDAAIPALSRAGVLCGGSFNVTVGESTRLIPTGTFGRLDRTHLVGESRTAAGTVFCPVRLERPLRAARVLERGTGLQWTVDLDAGQSVIAIPVEPEPDAERRRTNAEYRLVDAAGRPVVTAPEPGSAPKRVPLSRRAAVSERSAITLWQAAPPTPTRHRVLDYLGAPPDEAWDDDTGLDAALDAAAVGPAHRAFALLDALPPELRHSDAATLTLARLERDRGLLLPASDRLRTLAAPSLETQLFAASLLADVGALPEAQAAAAALAANHPHVPAAVELLATLYQQRQITEKSVATYRALDALAPTDSTLYTLFDLERGLGRRHDAAVTLQALLARRGSSPSYWVEALRFYADTGDRASLELVSATAHAVFPYDPDLHEAIGTAALERGDSAKALIAFHESLRLRPHQPELRARTERLDRERTDFAAPYRTDPTTLPRAMTDPTSAAGKGRFRVSQRVTRVDAGGTSATWVQQIFEAGALTETDGRLFNLDYDPSLRSVVVLDARRISADGAETPADLVDDIDLSSGADAFYYEARASRVSFTQVSAGDLLVVEQLVSDFAENPLGDIYSEVAALSGLDACDRCRAIWLAPKVMGLRISASSDAVAIRRTGDGGDRSDAGSDLDAIEASLDGAPALVIEPDMPGVSEALDYVHISSLPDWAAVGQWFERLAGDGLARTAESDALARRLVGEKEGAPSSLSDAEKVNVIFEFVARSIRYVGLEFGVHGYKPYGVSATLQRKFGDCKDKATLMRALLAAVGVESDLVLVRTKPKGRLRDQTASPSGFDHAILYVPSLDRYYDATASWNSPTELPWADRGATVLVLGKEGARFVQIPEGSPADSSFRLTLSPTAMGLSGTITAAGDRAAELRQALATEAERDDTLERLLGTELQAVELTRATYDLDFGPGPITITFEAKRTGDELPLLPPGFVVRRRLASLSSRTTPLQLTPLRIERTAGLGAFGLPLEPGTGAPPASARVDSEFGFAERVVTDASVTLILEITATRVPTDAYGRLRDFAAAADALFLPVSKLVAR